MKELIESYMFAKCFGLATAKPVLMSMLAMHIVGLVSFRCNAHNESACPPVILNVSAATA